MGPPMLFGVRLWASVCLALYIAFWLELDNPVWAATSAAYVCQPHLGASLRKGWYRMVGTVVGAMVIVVLTACFLQERAALPDRSDALRARDRGVSAVRATSLSPGRHVGAEPCQGAPREVRSDARKHLKDRHPSCFPLMRGSPYQPDELGVVVEWNGRADSRRRE